MKDYMKVLLVDVNYAFGDEIVLSESDPVRTAREHVKGWIESVVVKGLEGMVLLVDEDAKMKGRSANCWIRTKFNQKDYVAGDFIIVGFDGDKFTSMTQEQIEIAQEWIKENKI